MAMRSVKLGTILAVLVALAPAASANGFHHGHSRFFFGFSTFVPVFPYPVYPYYPPYYYPPPPAYGYPPAGYQTPLYLGAEVGQGCREYTAPVTVGGMVVQSYGIACLRPDGSWRILN